MILDYENIFSKDQAVAATALSSHIVDLGPGDTGPSEALSLFVSASRSYTGSGTMEVQVLTADDLNAAGDALSGAVTLAKYAAGNDKLIGGGKLVAARLPHGMKRYMRLNYAVTGTIADGTLTAGLVLDAQANEYVAGA